MFLKLILKSMFYFLLLLLLLFIFAYYFLNPELIHAYYAYEGQSVLELDGWSNNTNLDSNLPRDIKDIPWDIIIYILLWIFMP